MKLVIVAFVFLLICLSVMAADDEDAARRRQVKLKTTGQLKKIFKELKISFDESMSKEELRELAYKEDAVERWLELHPEKRPKKDNFGGMPNSIPDEMPEGMDPQVWEQLMRQMRGNDFSHVQDPEKRKILERLSATGLQFSGAADMELEQLRELEKMMNSGNFPGAKEDEL